MSSRPHFSTPYLTAPSTLQAPAAVPRPMQLVVYPFVYTLVDLAVAPILLAILTNVHTHCRSKPP